MIRRRGFRLQFRLRGRVLLVVAIAVAAVTGLAGASSGGTVKVAVDQGLGVKILVDSRGFTLYHLTTEKKGSVTCTGACRKSWPPLLVAGSAKPTAGAGLSASKLGTIRRPDGGVEVTYAGYALHRYIGDTKAGRANGQGVDGVWYALTPSGAVTKARANTSPTSASTTPSKVPSSGGGTSTGTGTGGNGSATQANGCPAGQVIPQGTFAGDGDEDNTNGGDPEDGDGCS
jgi:predicted lipoprotein with Yx(FWY)xxD motif